MGGIPKCKANRMTDAERLKDHKKDVHAQCDLRYIAIHGDENDSRRDAQL